MSGKVIRVCSWDKIFKAIHTLYPMEEGSEEYMKFLSYLALTKGLMDRTVAHYMGYFKLFDMTKISQEYVNEFAQQHKNNSIVRGMLLNMLDFYGLNKTIDMPPKRTGSKKKRAIRGITKEELETFKAHLYKSSFKKGLIFELLYQGALRRFELASIKLSSFKWMDWFENPSDYCRLVVLGKGDKERTVLINPDTAEKIMQHFVGKYNFKDMNDLREFTNSPSSLFGKVSEHYVWEMIHKESIKAIGRDIRPHELRHQRASELDKMGASIKDIKVYLGHANLSTTEIYLHKEEKESVDNIRKILAENSQA